MATGGLAADEGPEHGLPPNEALPGAPEGVSRTDQGAGEYDVSQTDAQPRASWGPGFRIAEKVRTQRSAYSAQHRAPTTFREAIITPHLHHRPMRPPDRRTTQRSASPRRRGTRHLPAPIAPASPPPARPHRLTRASLRSTTPSRTSPAPRRPLSLQQSPPLTHTHTYPHTHPHKRPRRPPYRRYPRSPILSSSRGGDGQRPRCAIATLRRGREELQMSPKVGATHC